MPENGCHEGEFTGLIDLEMKSTLKKELQGFLALLQRPCLTFFPIRHHSPACAWHLQKLIRVLRPSVLLIEGPESINQWIPHLVQAELKPPVAVYMNWADQGRKRKVDSKEEVPGPTTPRFATYFPLCDYSPELVALREGNAVEAGLFFIDLPYSGQVMTDHSLEDRPEDWRNFSLLREAHLNSSKYVLKLARRMGCRDHDELWDHLFENRAREISTTQFMENVAAYCYMARREYDPSLLEFDGTLARERAMAGHIGSHLQRIEEKGEGHVLVVTGGFHTAYLPKLLFDQEVQAGKTGPPDEAEYYLIRYSFDQLDALNGYTAGMRSPRYYDLIWTRLNEESPDPYLETATDLLVEIGRLTREKQLPFAVSAADEIAALEHARLLAHLRGHRGPVREDFLDAVRSCYVKGAMEAEGALVMKIVQAALAGNRVGQLPEGLPLPPLVANFHETAVNLRLNLENATRSETILDIYRKLRHRKVSRHFHCLNFLEVPFARMLNGPDFAAGIGLDYLKETWEYGWSPGTDGALIKASIYGSTVEEAAATRLDEAMLKMEQEGRGRSAGMMVQFLLRALQMGIHRQINLIVGRIAFGLTEDSDFNSVVDALRQLILIQAAREPLEAARILSLPQLADDAYRKACFLVQDLESIPLEQTQAVVENLCVLGETLEVGTGGAFDPNLLNESLTLLTGRVQGNTGVIGAAWGLLYRSGLAAPDRLRNTLLGYLDAAVLENRDKTAFIYGLLRACRELSWRDDWFVQALDALWRNWDDQEFARRLPELRLAFSGLTPGETDQVAACAARLYGAQDLGELVVRDITEAEIQRNLVINEAVKQSLLEDGLDFWLEIWNCAAKGEEG